MEIDNFKYNYDPKYDTYGFLVHEEDLEDVRNILNRCSVEVEKEEIAFPATNLFPSIHNFIVDACEEFESASKEIENLVLKYPKRRR